MHKIGNADHALEILEWVHGGEQRYGRSERVYNCEAPLGWEYLGSGSFRSVWLSPDGVAYKVSHHDWDSQSSTEIKLLAAAWEAGVPDNRCRLPKFDWYVVGDSDIVIAVEAILNGCTLSDYEGNDRSDMYDLMNTVERHFGLRDMHDENIMVDKDGYLVPVDFGW